MGYHGHARVNCTSSFDGLLLQDSCIFLSITDIACSTGPDAPNRYLHSSVGPSHRSHLEDEVSRPDLTCFDKCLTAAQVFADLNVLRRPVGMSPQDAFRNDIQMPCRRFPLVSSSVSSQHCVVIPVRSHRGLERRLDYLTCSPILHFSLASL